MTKLEVYVGFVNADKQLLQRKEPAGWKIIRWFQGSPLVHTFMAFRELDEKIWVYETSETLYHRVTFEERSEGTPLKMFLIDDADYAAAQSYCRSKLGTPYDYPAVLGLGLFYLLEKLMNILVWPLQKYLKMPKIVLKFENPYDVPQLLFCSQSVVECLQVATGRQLITELICNSSGALNPQMLYEYLRKHYNEVNFS